jgi:2-amino-4-hydroxy-6-hydroxymethyldihydropteridine diphosphokinase
MIARAFVGVGSNIDAERNVGAALRALRRAVRLLTLSTFYRTEPIGHPNDPRFVNGIAEIETDRPAEQLKWEVLRPIENQLGRARALDPDAPRTIDLDLLVYALKAAGSEGRLLVDPLLEERAFLAWPLLELAPELVLPDGRSIRMIAEQLSRDGMTALPELTARLRAEVRLG